MMVLIAANGDGSRWCGPEPKVLAEADGEPLLLRTVRRCRERGVQPFVLSNRPDVLDAAGDSAHRVLPSGSICDTLLSARDVWCDSRGVLLLGDVWYTDGALVSALRYRGALVKAWGNHQEVFALAWADGLAPVVERCANAAREHGGKLWHMLRIMDGIAPRSHAVLPSMLTMVNDGTRDFDHVQDLERWHADR